MLKVDSVTHGPLVAQLIRSTRHHGNKAEPLGRATLSLSPSVSLSSLTVLSISLFVSVRLKFCFPVSLRAGSAESDF